MPIGRNIEIDFAMGQLSQVIFALELIDGGVSAVCLYSMK